MTTGGVSWADDGPAGLFDGPSGERVHTSAAAEMSLLLGLFALLASPFSVMQTVVLGAGALGFVLAIGGMAATSNPRVAGRALVPLGLATSVVALVLVGMRYLGADTAFGDELVPTIAAWLAELNSLFPQS